MANNTFSRSSRLLTSEDYDKVFKNPVRVSAPGVLILAKLNQEPEARLGLVVSKKVLKRAVWRNRVKRVTADVVFIARPGIGEIGNRQLSSCVTRLWDQISRRLKSQQS